MTFYKISDICKRRRITGPTPCWWPECTCEQEANRLSRGLIERAWDGFIMFLCRAVVRLNWVVSWVRR